MHQELDESDLHGVPTADRPLARPLRLWEPELRVVRREVLVDRAEVQHSGFEDYLDESMRPAQESQQGREAVRSRTT